MRLTFRQNNVESFAQQMINYESRKSDNNVTFIFFIFTKEAGSMHMIIHVSSQFYDLYKTLYTDRYNDNKHITFVCGQSVYFALRREQKPIRSGEDMQEIKRQHTSRREHKSILFSIKTKMFTSETENNFWQRRNTRVMQRALCSDLNVLLDYDEVI